MQAAEFNSAAYMYSPAVTIYVVNGSFLLDDDTINTY